MNERLAAMDCPVSDALLKKLEQSGKRLSGCRVLGAELPPHTHHTREEEEGGKIGFNGESRKA